MLLHKALLCLHSFIFVVSLWVLMDAASLIYYEGLLRNSQLRLVHGVSLHFDCLLDLFLLICSISMVFCLLEVLRHPMDDLRLEEFRVCDGGKFLAELKVLGVTVIIMLQLGICIQLWVSLPVAEIIFFKYGSVCWFYISIVNLDFLFDLLFLLLWLLWFRSPRIQLCLLQLITLPPWRSICYNCLFFNARCRHLRLF